MTGAQIALSKVISSFLAYLNESTDQFILKGGTALLMCYGLDRFSEDIDLDGLDINIQDYVAKFCELHGYSYRTAKDTETVKRYLIHYNDPEKPLKVEVSYRRREISSSEWAIVNGIAVYTIDALCIMKSNAYAGRDKIRDLYDLAFICNKYYSSLSPQTIAVVRGAVEYKGIEQFDYIIEDQCDELIDISKLAEDFLKMFDRLGLLYDDVEKRIIDATIKPARKPLKKQSRGEPER